MLACVGTKFRAHSVQGMQKRRRLHQGATATHLKQGIFLLMLNNIYTFNTFIAHVYLLYYFVSLDAFPQTIAIGLSIFACL